MLSSVQVRIILAHAPSSSACTFTLYSSHLCSSIRHCAGLTLAELAFKVRNLELIDNQMDWATMQRLLRLSPRGCAFKLSEVGQPSHSSTGNVRLQLRSLLKLRFGLYIALVLLNLRDGVVAHFITFDSFRQLLFIGGGRSMNGRFVAGDFAFESLLSVSSPLLSSNFRHVPFTTVLSGVLELEPEDVADPVSSGFVDLLVTTKMILAVEDIRRLDVSICPSTHSRCLHFHHSHSPLLQVNRHLLHLTKYVAIAEHTLRGSSSHSRARKRKRDAQQKAAQGQGRGAAFVVPVCGGGAVC